MACGEMATMEQWNAEQWSVWARNVTRVEFETLNWEAVQVEKEKCGTTECRATKNGTVEFETLKLGSIELQSRVIFLIDTSNYIRNSLVEHMEGKQ